MAWHEILALGGVQPEERTYQLHRLWQVRGGRRLHSDRKEGPGDFRRQGKKPVIFPLTTGQKRL